VHKRKTSKLCDVQREGAFKISLQYKMTCNVFLADRTTAHSTVIN